MSVLSSWSNAGGWEVSRGWSVRPARPLTGPYLMGVIMGFFTLLLLLIDLYDLMQLIRSSQADNLGVCSHSHHRRVSHPALYLMRGYPSPSAP